VIRMHWVCVHEEVGIQVCVKEGRLRSRLQWWWDMTEERSRINPIPVPSLFKVMWHVKVHPCFRRYVNGSD
jgi:hypothetical protein